MAEQIYLYDNPTAGFSWNAYHQKVKQAIGRVPIGTAIVGSGQMAIRFDPPLTIEEEPLVAAIFADPATAASVPDMGESFVIKDCFDSSFMEDLAIAIEGVHGTPVTPWIWFYRGDVSTPEGTTDRIALTFDRDLTVQESKAANSAISDLLIGWTTVVEV